MIQNLEKFRLNSVKNRNYFKDVCGIYALLYEGEVIYIGKSKNIADRLRRHNAIFAVDSILNTIKKENGRCDRSKELALHTLIDEHRNDIYFCLVGTCAIDELEEYKQEYIGRYNPIFNSKRN